MQSNSLNLKHLMNTDEYVDNTNKIRELKHSEDILLDVAKICKIKNEAEYKTKSKEELEELRGQCSAEANFLFSNYTDIFHKVFNDELDLKMLVEFVKILKRIEENDLDQYNGSVMVGKILHDMYISSAQARSKKMDEEMAATSNRTNTSDPDSATKSSDPPYDPSFSWKQFKTSSSSSSSASASTDACSGANQHRKAEDNQETFVHYTDFKHFKLYT